MKASIKKRLEKLERSLQLKNSRKRVAKIIYDPSIPNFDPMMLGIDADIVLMAPDNGRRYPRQDVKKDE